MVGAVAHPVAAVPTRAAAEQEEPLPVPPIPPADPPSDVAAPVPDTTLEAPGVTTEQGLAVKPTLNANPPKLPGGDPVPGTLYRLDQEQKRQFIPSPGLELVVPLQK
jgi:hypothetical protein